jgi:2-hydroxy-6-oxonona-2,4-dienedioate hydrolase
MLGLIIMSISTTSFADTRETINVNGLDISYLDVGQGPSLLLIHGLGADLTRFEHNIGYLSQTHRVIAIDLPGFGKSERNGKQYDGKLFVDTIEALRERLALGKVSLVGNSMGGWVSLLYTKYFKENVTSLVLIAPAFVQGLPSSVTAATLITGASPNTQTQMQNYLSRVTPFHEYNANDVQELLAQHQQKNRGKAIAAIAKSLSNAEYVFTDKELAEIATRTLILHGDSDGIVPFSSSKGLMQKLANAEIVAIKEAGHWPQWDNAEKVNQLLTTFLFGESQ